jgi:hypothetical protein
VAQWQRVPRVATTHRLATVAAVVAAPEIAKLALADVAPLAEFPNRWSLLRSSMDRRTVEQSRDRVLVSVARRNRCFCVVVLIACAVVVAALIFLE